MTNPDLYNLKPNGIVLYGADWCPDCKRSKAFLAAHNIQYLDVNIGKDNLAYAFIEKLTRRVVIPTLIFPDGTILVEPSDEALSLRLGIH